MKTLKDIKFYQTGIDKVFDEENSSLGTIILSDDNSFEGIVYDFFCPTKYFIFGNIIPEVGIDFVKVRVFDKEKPVLFRGNEGEGYFYGRCFTKDPYSEKLCGDCKIKIINPESYREVVEDLPKLEKAIQDPESYREVGEAELPKLEKAIQEYKEKLGEDSRVIYESMMGEEPFQK